MTAAEDEEERYAQAFGEWLEDLDNAVWDQAIGDGLGDEPTSQHVPPSD